MPSLATVAVVRDDADGLPIALNARCLFVAGAPSDTVYTLKGRVPDHLDVILQSDLVITLAGQFNRVNVTNRAMQRSAMAQHLLNYFHVNSEQLSLRVASKIFVDEDDGNIKLTLSSTRPFLDRRPPFVRLCTIELLYACRTPHVSPQPHHIGDKETSGAMDPFSPHAFLPLVAALDRIVEKFVAVHLVRSYPLIFGTWRKRFDAEVAVSIKIARAITDIIARSPQGRFKKRSHRMLKVLHNRSVAANAMSASSLLACLSDAAREDLEEVEEGASIPCDPQVVLAEAIEAILKTGLKPTRYQGSVSMGGKQETKNTSACNDDLHLWDSDSNVPLDSKCPVSGPDAPDPVELSFDEANSLPGSEEDLVFDDLDERDFRVLGQAGSVFAFSSPQLETFDDLWDSSQSTLDVCVPFSYLWWLIICCGGYRSSPGIPTNLSCTPLLLT
ncbi:hypothetical protein C8Q74DRAFT_894488 [Fomes fomentarius]|nr:hypothetical protein C8Q74DRAFT_894488 [Fomes fomentarius]